MNNAKIVLVACISAFVAITTYFLGVTGTIIGSVLSSVLYNVLAEALEKPVTDKFGNSTKLSFDFNLEYEIAYLFPLVVIIFIQLLLLAAFLSQWGILPGTFLNAYLKIQHVLSNNLYRILGISLLVMAIYPFILKPNIIKKSHGAIVGFIGLIFLARGFADGTGPIALLLAKIFGHFDFAIMVFAFILLVIVILLIAKNAANNLNKSNSNKNNDFDYDKVMRGNHRTNEYNNYESSNFRNQPNNIRVNRSKYDNRQHEDDYGSERYPHPQKNNHFRRNSIKAIKNPRFRGNEPSDEFDEFDDKRY